MLRRSWDGRESDDGLPSQLVKTHRRKTEKEGLVLATAGIFRPIIEGAACCLVLAAWTFDQCIVYATG